MKRYCFFLLYLLATSLSLFSQEQTHFPIDSLYEGDLLFVVNAGSNAITDVTHGIGGYPIDHVAIFHWVGTEPMVIQAVPCHGVEMVSLDSLNSMLLIGRVGAADFDARGSIARAQRHIGKPYDDYFDANDQAL